MKIRRLAALMSAAVLALGMVTAVSAHPMVRTAPQTNCDPASTEIKCQPETTSEPTWQPTDGQCQNEQGQPIDCGTAEPTSEPTKEPTSEPTKEPTSEPTKEPTSEPTGEPTSEPTTAPTNEPTDDDGQVEGLTSQPTLPPTDVLSSNSTSGPDGTLPLVLIVLGVIGLAAVVLTPARSKR